MAWPRSSTGVRVCKPSQDALSAGDASPAAAGALADEPPHAVAARAAAASTEYTDIHGRKRMGAIMPARGQGANPAQDWPSLPENVTISARVQELAASFPERI